MQQWLMPYKIILICYSLFPEKSLFAIWEYITCIPKIAQHFLLHNSGTAEGQGFNAYRNINICDDVW